MDQFDLPADLLTEDHHNLWRHLTRYQGDDWIFEVDLLNHSAGEYTLTYQWANLKGGPFSMDSSADGDSFSFNVPAATTAGYLPGKYRVQAVLTNLSTGTRHTLGIQEGQVLPSLLTVADPRSPNRKALDVVEAALTAGAGSDIIEYEVGGKKIKKSRPQMLQLRAYYLQRCRVEDGHGMGRILFSL